MGFGVSLDDLVFDNLKTAQKWISSVESQESLSVRSRDIYPMLKAWVAELNPHKVLEIGCGQGICAAQLSLLDGSYTGVDPCSIMIDRANELCKVQKCKFELGNAYKLPFEQGTFDAVFSVAVWHLLGDLKSAANELSRVLSESGHFFVITANPGAAKLWTRRYIDGRISGKRFEGRSLFSDSTEDIDTLFFHSVEEMVDSFEVANLSVQRILTFRTSEEDAERIPYYISIYGQKLNRKKSLVTSSIP